MRVIRVSRSLVNIRSSGREKVSEEGHCRMCGRDRRVRQLTRHHVVPQSWFNAIALEMERGSASVLISARHLQRLRNCDANIIPLCAPCHALVEDWGVEGRRARSMLRRLMLQEEVAYAIQLRGKAWLDDRYPDAGLPLPEPIIPLPDPVAPERPRQFSAREKHFLRRRRSLEYLASKYPDQAW